MHNVMISFNNFRSQLSSVVLTTQPYKCQQVLAKWLNGFHSLLIGYINNLVPWLQEGDYTHKLHMCHLIRSNVLCFQQLVKCENASLVSDNVLGESDIIDILKALRSVLKAINAEKVLLNCDLTAKQHIMIRELCWMCFQNKLLGSITNVLQLLCSFLNYGQTCSNAEGENTVYGKLESEVSFHGKGRMSPVEDVINPVLLPFQSGIGTDSNESYKNAWKYQEKEEMLNAEMSGVESKTNGVSVLADAVEEVIKSKSDFLSDVKAALYITIHFSYLDPAEMTSMFELLRATPYISFCTFLDCVKELRGDLFTQSGDSLLEDLALQRVQRNPGAWAVLER